MLKKFGYSLLVVGALVVGVGAASATFVGSAMANEAKCDKCGHTAKRVKIASVNAITSTKPMSQM